MMETQIIDGHKFVYYSNLHTWEVNDVLRNAQYADFIALKNKLKRLGQFRPLLVLEDGTIIGGNHRYKAITALVQEGYQKLENVWITVLSFNQLPDGSFQALIDGIPQEIIAADTQQIKLEYMTADNDETAHWVKEALAEQIQPYKDEIPMDDYNFSFGWSTNMRPFIEEFNPGEQDYQQESVEEKKAEEVKTIVARFSPDQFVDVEPMLEQAKDSLGVKNNADLLTRLLEHYNLTSGISILPTEEPNDQANETPMAFESAEEVIDGFDQQNTLQVDQPTEDAVKEDFATTGNPQTPEEFNQSLEEKPSGI